MPNVLQRRLRVLQDDVERCAESLHRRTSDPERCQLILQAVKRAVRAADAAPDDVCGSLGAPLQPEPSSPDARRLGYMPRGRPNQRLAALSTEEQMEYLRARHRGSIESARAVADSVGERLQRERTEEGRR